MPGQERRQGAPGAGQRHLGDNRVIDGSFEVEPRDQVPIPPLPEVGGPGGWWPVCWDGGSACPRISHSGLFLFSSSESWGWGGGGGLRWLVP